MLRLYALLCLVCACARADESECLGIPDGFVATEPRDYGMHATQASYESWWYMGILETVAPPTSTNLRFGYSFRVDRCSAGCRAFNQSTWALTVYVTAFSDASGGRRLGKTHFFTDNHVYWETPESDATLAANPYVIKFGHWQLRETSANASTFTIEGRVHQASIALRLEKTRNYSQILHAHKHKPLAVHLVDPRLRSWGSVTVPADFIGAIDNDTLENITADDKHTADQSHKTDQKTRTFTVAGVSFGHHYWTTLTCPWINKQRWKLLFLQLSNNVEVLVSQSFVMEHGTSGAWKNSNGYMYIVTRHGATQAVSDFVLTPTCEWQSPRTNLSYPVCHTLSSADAHVLLYVAPLVPESELFRQEQPFLFEAVSQVFGVMRGERVAGTGATELKNFGVLAAPLARAEM